MSSNIANPVVAVTNQSGVDVEIFDVYNPSPDGQKGLYTYTSLGKVANGAKANISTLRFASQLLAVYTGPVAAINGTYYEKFPVAVMGVSILDDTTLTQTISADDKAGMEQAFLFSRYSGANADSKLTQQFVTALNATSQKTAVDTFFAGTANFSKANMASWSAVTTWQSQFLSAWQGPYYLYQNDPNAKTIKLIAVANIVSSAGGSSATLYIAGQDGTYSTSSQNTGMAQAGDGTINEQNVGTSPISLTLTPVWMNISTVGMDGSVSYALGGAMSGVVNGIKVMGTGQKITMPSSSSGSSGSDWYDKFSKIYSLTLSTVGMLTSMGMLFIMFKQWKGEKTQKADDIVNKSTDPKANKDTIEQAQKASDQQVDAQMAPKAEHQSSATQSQVKDLSTTAQDLTTANQQVEAQQTIDTQTEKISELLTEAPPNDKTEQAVSEVMQSKESLANGDVDGAFKNLNDASSTIVEMSQDVNSGMSEAQKADAEAIKQDMDASADIQKDMQEEQEQQDKLKEQDASDDIPSDKVTDDAPSTPAFEGGE